MIFFEDTQRLMRSLLDEGRHYADLQKMAVKKDVSQGLAHLLSALAVSFVILLLLSIILMFVCVALAFCFGHLLNNTAWGFAIMGAAFCLLLLVVFLKRRAWISLPLHRLVDSTLGNSPEDPTREQLEQALQQSRAQMRNLAGDLSSPTSSASSNLQRLTRIASWGYAAYEGVRMSSAVVSSLVALFGKRKKRR